MDLTGMLGRFLRFVIALLMTLMVGAVVWQVLSRYLFVVPAAWTEEMARFLLIWIGMLGAAYAYRCGSHLGLDLLSNRLDNIGRQRLFRLIHTVCFLFAAAVLVVGGGALVSMTWELKQISAAMGLPIALVYAVIPASGVLICLFAVESIVAGEVKREH